MNKDFLVGLIYLKLDYLVEISNCHQRIPAKSVHIDNLISEQTDLIITILVEC